MKLSVSNIAWQASDDDEMYAFLSKNNFAALEIAPTRIFPVNPYDNLIQAKHFAKKLKEEYNLSISSMQSIWFGKAEFVFGSDSDRQKLIGYTKKAVDFAVELNCPNLVFGCPKNRAVPQGVPAEDYLPAAYDFFNCVGDYSAKCGVYTAIEPNPVIYNTNFINTTAEAAEFCRGLNNPGIKINADLGAVIHNDENTGILADNIDLISHIHISEPLLAPIEKRVLHKKLKTELEAAGYNKFISIEMAKLDDIDTLKKIIIYIKKIFN